MDLDRDQQRIDGSSVTPSPPPASSMPTLADLRGVVTDLDDIDEVLARLDATDGDVDGTVDGARLGGPEVPDRTDEASAEPAVPTEPAVRDDEGPGGQEPDFAIR